MKRISSCSNAILRKTEFQQSVQNTWTVVCSELRNRDFMKVEGMDCDSVNDMVVIKHITNREGTKLITENTEHQSDSQNLLRSSYFTPNDHCFSLFSLQLHTFWVAYVKNIVCTVLKTILFGQNYFAFNETRDTLNTIKVLTVVLHFILHHSNKN